MRSLVRARPSSVDARGRERAGFRRRELLPSGRAFASGRSLAFGCSRLAKIARSLPVMLLSVVVVGVTIAPWTIRNAKVFGHFVPMSTSDGVNLWMGNNPESSGIYLPLPGSVQELNEYDQNRILSEDAMLYMSEHPLEFVSRTLEKAVLLHVTETTAITWNFEGIRQRNGENAVFPLKLLTQGFWTGVLLLAFGGIIVLVRRDGILQALTNPALLIWIYFTAVYSIFVVADRYHFPSHPFISMLAAVAVLASAVSSSK